MPSLEKIRSLLPAVLLTLACSYYYLAAAEKPQHLLFYAAFAGILWQHRTLLRPMALQPLILLLLGYVGYQAVSLSWSPVWSGEELGEVIRKGLLSLLFMMSAALVFSGEKARLYFWQGLVTVAAVSAAIALALHYSASPIPERLNGLGRSLNAVQGGCLYGLALIGAVWLGMQDKTNRMFWVACWAVLLLALGATMSRGALLAAFAAHLCLVLSYRRQWIRWLWIPVLLAVVAVWLLFPEILQRADSFRLAIWQEVWRQVAPHWAWGLGYRAPLEMRLTNGEIIYQPHSIYITALYYGGAGGVLCLLAVFVFAWRLAGRPLTKALLLNAAIIGLVDFNLLLVNGKIEWLLFWLPLAMVCAQKTKEPDAYPT